MRSLLVLLLSVLLIYTSGCSPKLNGDEIMNYNKTSQNKDGMFYEKEIITEPAKETENVKEFTININEVNIMDTIIKLCQSPRRWGTEGEREAFDFLKLELEQYGYTCSSQKFPVYKQDLKSFSTNLLTFFNLNPYNSEVLGYGYNLITKKYSTENTEKTLVLSAHYDTITNSIGAIDNASGTSVLLEVAKQLKDYSAPFNIEFVFFSAEEYYLSGSKYYINQLTEEEKSNILACINIDMVGEKGAGDIVMCTPQGLPTVINYVVEDVLGRTFESKYQGTSDHASFSIANIPAVTIDQPNRDHAINKMENQIEFLDSDKLKDTAEIICEIVTQYDMELHQNLIQNSTERNRFRQL